MDGRKEGGRDKQIHRQAARQTNGRIDKQTERRTHSQMNTRMGDWWTIHSSENLSRLGNSGSPSV
eukprot:scaffold145653_cov25-Prasinocladus_malaysianus.AAC.1